MIIIRRVIFLCAACFLFGSADLRAADPTVELTSILATEWKNVKPDRLAPLIHRLLLAEALSRESGGPSIDDGIRGIQAEAIAEAVVAVCGASEDRAVGDAFPALVNLDGPLAGAGVRRAIRRILTVVDQSRDREVEQALWAIQALGMKEDNVVRERIRTWSASVKDARKLYAFFQSSGQDSIIADQIWASLWAADPLLWMPEQQKLAFRMPLNTGNSERLASQAALQIVGGADDAPVEKFPLAVMTQLRPDICRDIVAEDIGARLRDVALRPTTIRGMLAMWLMTLGREPTVREVLVPALAKAVPGWCSDAAWAASGKPNDRIHDLILAAMAAFPSTSSASIYAAVLPRATQAGVGVTGSTKVTMNRIAVWSLAWRTAPDPAAFLAAHSRLGQRLAEGTSASMWYLMDTAYGRSFLSRTNLPSRSGRPPEAMLKALEGMPPGEARFQKALGVHRQYAEWEGFWAEAASNWKDIPVFQPGILDELQRRALRSEASPTVMAFVRDHVVPLLRERKAAAPVLANAALTVAWALPKEPDAPAWIAGIPNDSGFAWDSAADALLQLDKAHPRILKVLAALQGDKHPADPVFIWLLQALRGENPGPWPVDAWACILDHPAADYCLAIIERHVEELARRKVALRDPRCLAHRMSAGLERPTESEDAQRVMRLLGIIDLQEALRRGCRPPDGVVSSP